MNYLISAVLCIWIVFSLITAGAGILSWVAMGVLLLLIAAWFLLDSRCPKCRRFNALAHAEEGPGVGKDVPQAHFQCHHCGHRLSRKAPLSRLRSRRPSRPADS
ncbi:MAG: hypothetical protein EA349_14555 [Halomonadaceae bacterium]|nr:MAG: hypothetical protein EA349_14555 [Halomonadaceae bacterium]